MNKKVTFEGMVESTATCYSDGTTDPETLTIWGIDHDERLIGFRRGRYKVTLETEEEDDVKDNTLTFEVEIKDNGYGTSYFDAPLDVDVSPGTYTVTLTPVPQEPELKLCPFCGTEPYKTIIPPRTRVTCWTRGCPMHDVWVTPAAWNRRDT